MGNLTVEDIVRESNGKLILGDKKFICRKFSKDTRIIEEGDIYIAIKGEKFDGNKFWREALKKGAAGVIIEKNNCTDDDKRKFENKIIIEVEDTLEALYCIAKYKRSLYNIPVIAITGSVGKTSTKDIVANVVNKKYTTLKTLGNNNNNIGLPFTILKMQNEEAMVLEMGMNHFGEISLLTSIAKPTICVITNIGTSHIGNLGSRENILKAKLEILEGCENPVVIINNDNDLLHDKKEIRTLLKDELEKYGIKEKSDLNAKNIKLESSNSKFDLKLNGKEETINVPVGGEHFILNSLCAAMVGKVLKIDNQKIKEGIESFELTKKRMDITELENGVKVINDAYNASLESMKASLGVLSEFKENRKIAILGDMFELGKYSKELHKKVGEEVIKNKIDILICSGTNSKYIIEKAREKMKDENVYYLENKEEILEVLKEVIKPGDVVLLKASNGMKFYELAERMISLWKKKD